MSVRKVPRKRAKNGYLYEVNFQYKERGITKHYWKSGFETKKEAKEHEDLKKSELVMCDGALLDCKKTLKEVYEEFMEIGKAEYQHNTLYNTQKTLHYWNGSQAEIDLGSMKITSLDYKILQEFFYLRREQGKSTNNDIKVALNRIFKYALRQNYIRSNPLEYVKVTGIDKKKEKHIISFYEYNSLIKALKNENTFYYDSLAIAVIIGYYTGMRLSEVMALSKEDINFESDLINVHKKLIYKGLKKEQIKAVEQLKSNSSRANVPIPQALKKELIQWFRINPYEKIICDEDGNYISCDVAGNIYRRIAKKLKIPFHFHLLRHAYTTNLIHAGVDIKVAQELLRHKNFNTTLSIYTHIQDSEKKNVVNKVFGEFLVDNEKRKNTLS